MTTSHEPATQSTEVLELLRTRLEEEYAAQTARLTRLTVYAGLPRHAGHDPRTLQALADTARRRIADAAHALRRMSEGSYGVCVDCGGPIPLSLLRGRPCTTGCGCGERAA